MKECAAQADRVASRAGLDSDKMVLGRQNHYSPGYGRCFLQITYQNREANSSDRPAIYYELWDAFEERLLSICTDWLFAGSGPFCYIQDDLNSPSWLSP